MEIYEPKGRAREYSPLALNYFKGCSHGCLYCYVPALLGKYNSSYKHSEVIPPASFDKLELSARKFANSDKQVLLSFTGDPYCGADPSITRHVLEILLKNNIKVAILTKGFYREIINDLPLFKQFGNRIKVGMTLTFSNDADSLKWESGASLPTERLSTLKKLADNGIKTWASFEPVISPNQSLVLLGSVCKFIDHVKIGKINNYKGLDKTIDWHLFLASAVSILRSNGMNDRFYIKQDLRAATPNFTDLTANECDQDFLNL
jgi:DNA repair photolyase